MAFITYKLPLKNMKLDRYISHIIIWKYKQPVYTIRLHYHNTIIITNLDFIIVYLNLKHLVSVSSLKNCFDLNSDYIKCISTQLYQIIITLGKNGKNPTPTQKS